MSLSVSGKVATGGVVLATLRTRILWLDLFYLRLLLLGAAITCKKGLICVCSCATSVYFKHSRCRVSVLFSLDIRGRVEVIRRGRSLGLRKAGRGLAQVEDGLGGGEVLDVPVLDELRTEGHSGEVIVEAEGRRPVILVLYRVLEAVGPEQARLSLGLDDLRPLEAEVLRLEEVLTLVMVMVSLLLPRGVGSETPIRGASRSWWRGW